MIGTTEILIIVGAVLLLFGGTQLPKLAKGLGSFVKEFKNAQETITNKKPKSKKKKISKK